MRTFGWATTWQKRNIIKMTKYNVYVAINETTEGDSERREDFAIESRNATAQEVYAILRLTLEKWVRTMGKVDK
jgi:hypothetical protein